MAAVLFIGLAIGALDPRLTLPPELISLGLILFVYSVGLASGPGFFASFSRSGLRDNLMVAGVPILARAAVMLGADQEVDTGALALLVNCLLYTSRCV